MFWDCSDYALELLSSYAWLPSFFFNGFLISERIPFAAKVSSCLSLSCHLVSYTSLGYLCMLS